MFVRIRGTMHLDYLLHAPKVCHATTLHGKRPSFQTTELWRKGMNSLRQELELWMMDCPPSIWTACVLPRYDCIVHCPFASSCRRVTIESDGNDTIPNWMSSSLDTNCSNHLIRKFVSSRLVSSRVCSIPASLPAFSGKRDVWHQLIMNQGDMQWISRSRAILHYKYNEMLVSFSAGHSTLAIIHHPRQPQWIPLGRLLWLYVIMSFLVLLET